MYQLLEDDKPAAWYCFRLTDSFHYLSMYI